MRFVTSGWVLGLTVKQCNKLVLSWRSSFFAVVRIRRRQLLSVIRSPYIVTIWNGRRQAAADPQPRPNDPGCESACRLSVEGCQKLLMFHCLCDTDSALCFAVCLQLHCCRIARLWSHLRLSVNQSVCLSVYLSVVAPLVKIFIRFREILQWKKYESTRTP